MSNFFIAGPSHMDGFLTDQSVKEHFLHYALKGPMTEEGVCPFVTLLQNPVF